MSQEHSQGDGSETFWPGYVDAVTNLVLNLLFLLVIMIIAVFMFALELGKTSKGGADKSLVSSSKRGDVTQKIPTDAASENIILKREIETLKMQLARQAVANAEAGVVEKTADATSRVPLPLKRLEKTVATSDAEVLVRFTDEAVSLTAAEHERLPEILKSIAAGGKAVISVEVPAGFSEARRMGFYRAMAVRNILIEMKMPKESIDVSVREVKKGGNASLVKVNSR